MVITVEIWYNISNAQKKKDDGSLLTNCYQNGKYVLSLSDQERAFYQLIKRVKP